MKLRTQQWTHELRRAPPAGAGLRWLLLDRPQLRQQWPDLQCAGQSFYQDEPLAGPLLVGLAPVRAGVARIRY